MRVIPLIADRLATIRQANGYRTDAGLRLHRGWPGHVLSEEEDALPLLAVHPETETPTASNGRARRRARTAVIEYVVDALRTAPDELEDVYEDIRDCIVALEAEATTIDGLHTVTQGTAEWGVPEDASAFARLMVPVTFNIITRS